MIHCSASNPPCPFRQVAQFHSQIQSFHPCQFHYPHFVAARNSKLIPIDQMPSVEAHHWNVKEVGGVVLAHSTDTTHNVSHSGPECRWRHHTTTFVAWLVVLLRFRHAGRLRLVCPPRHLGQTFNLQLLSRLQQGSQMGLKRSSWFLMVTIKMRKRLPAQC